MENNLKITDGKVEVVYLKFWAGCMVFSAGLMTLAGLFILFYIVPDSSIVRAFFGILIGIPGTLFFGAKLLQLLSVVLDGKTLLAVENGYLEGKKQRAAINEITDIYWSGLSFKVLIVRTANKKKLKFNTYNLVNENVIEHVVETYVVPHGTPELKTNWENRKLQKSA
ncbi:DUF5381 family protein [Bacillus sp. FJAT-29814]|uniref:DUF5381 family protein n=1 Tax=Bacillus sp. FJAT-29814 TaxID=1729688 RepID=UPI000829526E|nr:DUF5381 family protein [Bacillus sp. FJAT-29814]